MLRLMKRRCSRLAGRVHGRFDPRGIILLYHRVAQPPTDPWRLAVTPTHFDEQLAVIRKHATALALPDLLARLASGRMPHRSVAVTFDDGYADNLHAAKPVLDRHDTPATMFITTGRLGRRFWWDELQDVFLTPGALPGSLELTLDGQLLRWSLGDAAQYSAEQARRDRAWRPPAPPPTPRHAVFIDLWRRLRTMREEPRRGVLDTLAAWSRRDAHTAAPHRALTEQELRVLARDGQIAIGAHTVTHSRMSSLSPCEQRAELANSRRHIETILDRRVDMFAYPFGGRDDYTTAAVAMARDLGFTCACAAVGGTVRRSADPHQLPRCAVPDVGGDRFEDLLERWLRLT